MRTRKLGFASTILLVTPLLAVTSALPARAQLATSPWPMMHHDLHHTGRSPYVGPQGVDMRTMFPVRYQKTSPLIGPDGRVYQGYGKTVCALRPSDGYQWWCHQLPSNIRRNTPALAADGTLYIGARDNRLWAINPDGSAKWSYAVGNDGDVNVSPAVAPDGTVYMVGTFGGPMHALNPNGTLKWKLLVGHGGGVSYSSPAVGDDGAIYVGNTRGELVAVNPEGTLR